MTLERKTSAATPQVKKFERKAHVSKVSTRSHTAPVRPRKHLAWYVALKPNPFEEMLSRIPQIKWTCPPKCPVNNDWRVAYGEESQEADAQKQREKTLPEVVYRNLFAIPPNPLTSPSMECEQCDDSQIPVIPTEDTELDTSAAPVDCTDNVQPPVDPSGEPSVSQCNEEPVSKSLVEMARSMGVDLEVALAAAATVAAVMESREQIDTQLLIRLLTDPEMTKKLIDANGLGAKPQNATLPAEIPNTSFHLPCSKAETSSKEGLKLKPIYTSTPPIVSFMPDRRPIEKLVDENGLTAKPQNAPLPAQMPNISFPLPSSIPANNCSRPPSQAGPLISRPHARNQSLTQPPHSHIHQLAGVKVRPLLPNTTLRETDEMVSRITSKYNRGPLITGVNPGAPANPFTSKPSTDALKKLVTEFGGSGATPNMALMNGNGVREHAGGKPFLGQNPLHPVANPHIWPNAFNSNFTPPSNFQFPQIPAMNIRAPPPPADLNYYQSLIRQHGEANGYEVNNLRMFGQPGQNSPGLDLEQNRTIEMNARHKKPCMYFNSNRGCRNGANCSYGHDSSQHLVPGATVEAPPFKRMKFPN